MATSYGIVQPATMTYTVPLRRSGADVTITVPRDLTPAEAQRIGMVLYAIANLGHGDDTPNPTETRQ